MNRLLVYLGHLLLILVAYAIAANAASAFLHVMALGGLGWSAQELPPVIAGSIFFSIPFIALFIAYFAFVPAAFAIGLAEVIGARDWLFYAIAGGLAGAAVIALFWYSYPLPIDLGESIAAATPNMEPLDDPRVLLSIIGAGMIGGLAYWALAGRFAGHWRTV